MRKVVDYRICYERHVVSLVDLVNDWIKEGYEPIGNVILNLDFYMQAMVRYEEGDDDGNVILNLDFYMQAMVRYEEGDDNGKKGL